MTKYNVGDIVRVGKGKAEWVVISPHQYGRYPLKQVGGTGGRDEYHHNLTLIRPKDHNEQLKKEKDMTAKLYQIKDTETFVSQIGTNQEGKAVVEVKGTGEIKVVDKADLVEVVPFTITARDIVSGDARYFATKPDLVKVGDLLVVNARLLWVTSLNTKAENAKELPATALCLVTAPL